MPREEPGGYLFTALFRRWHETWEPLAVMARAGVLTLACGRENPKQLKL